MATDLDRFFKKGSVVYCDLSTFVDHSGIYVGNNEFVELGSDGVVRKVGVKEFMTSLSDQEKGKFKLKGKIYVFCQHTSDGKWSSIEFPQAYDRARSQVGITKKYGAIMDNCHMFTTGCVTGNFANTANTTDGIKKALQKHLGLDKESSDWASVDVEA
ncbi:lecithin retinol acyltransferase family protein [Helicobacter cynogastricus]|uniref:lecithin retinol acyltransferase family protein n=1 Tax=Helicobacter cynogastricus TaxID=329937 RepID=UPI000CF14F8E|nr:lecithin retinol acyltransferase family protein [Helicobacter cynogastricus]